MLIQDLRACKVRLTTEPEWRATKQVCSNKRACPSSSPSPVSKDRRCSVSREVGRSYRRLVQRVGDIVKRKWSCLKGKVKFDNQCLMQLPQSRVRSRQRPQRENKDLDSGSRRIPRLFAEGFCEEISSRAGVAVAYSSTSYAEPSSRACSTKPSCWTVR